MKVCKFRLYPSAEQKKLLEQQLDLCRELYNAFLEQRIYAHRARRSVGYYFQQNQIPELKKALPEFRGIHSQVLQDVAMRVDRAYQNFFLRIREKKSGKQQKAGYPRFKPVTRYRSLTYSQSGFEIVENGRLKLSKIGTVRMFMHRDVDGKIKTLNISRDQVGDWFASFSIEKDTIKVHINEEVKQNPNGVGIDLGLIHIAAMSDGEVIEPPHFLKRAEKRLKKEQRILSKKEKSSNNRNKQKRKVAKKQRKVKRQRDDFIHKVSNNLAKNNSLVSFENLNVKDMIKNHHLAKSIMDASWKKLIQYTTYKAESAGKMVVMVDPKGTSNTCSRCGWKKSDLELSDRIFHCINCGLEIDRDLNAAINIYKRGLEKIGRGTPEVTPVEIGALPKRATPVFESGSPLRQRGEDVT